MKTTLKLISLLALSSMLFTSCFVRSTGGKSSSAIITGNPKTTTYDWNNITSIEASSADIEYYQSDSLGYVELTMDEGYYDGLEISNDNGKLSFKVKNNSIINFGKNETKMVLKVYSPSLESLSYAGSGDVTFCNGLFSDGNLDVSLAGSGDINLGNLTVDTISVALAGSGDIDAKSLKCSSCKAGVAGSGDITLSNIEADSMETGIAGSGDITLSGHTGTLSTKISGSGDIDYKNLVFDSSESSK